MWPLVQSAIDTRKQQNAGVLYSPGVAVVIVWRMAGSAPSE
jgi:hypothetical protein